MGTPTYTALANITLGSSAASVTFSSINTSLYRDLVLVCSGKTSSSLHVYASFNGETTGNKFFGVIMQGNGSTTGSSTANDSYIYATDSSPWDSTNVSTIIFNIMDYAATDKHKPILVRSNNAGVGVSSSAFRWASTSAVTSIRLEPFGNFSAGSTFALYGIAA